MSIDTTKQSYGTGFVLNWDSTDLGGVDDVKYQGLDDVGLSPIKAPANMGANVKVDDVATGPTDPAVIVTCTETTVAQLRKLCPWAGVSGAVAIVPPPGTKMYALAKLLTVHRVEDGASTVNDVHCLKATPVGSVLIARGKGIADHDTLTVKFNLYPDAAKLAAGAAGVSAYMEIKGS